MIIWCQPFVQVSTLTDAAQLPSSIAHPQPENILSIFRMIRSAHCTAAATSDSVARAAIGENPLFCWFVRCKLKPLQCDPSE